MCKAKTIVLLINLFTAISTFCQCGPEGWWEELWYGINGGACSYGEPSATFFPSFPKCNNKPYILIFEEDFNGSQLDNRLWQGMVSPQGSLTNSASQEYNTNDNVTFNNGICTITARRQDILARAIPYYPDNEILDDGLQNMRLFNYTSANLWTKFRFGFGKYEIKYRVDLQQGMWPAFWLYNKDDGIGNEIDWFELTGNNPTRWTGTLHHDRYGDGCDHFCLHGLDNASDFSQWNIFSGQYSFDHVNWSLNGSSIDYRPRYVTSAGNIIECGDNISNSLLFEPPHWPLGKFPIIINMAVYRGADEAPSESFDAANYDIDYIKHYVQDGCCGDLTVSNNQNLDMSNDPTDYNYLCAKTINVSNNVNIYDGQNMAFVAINNIIFNPGFNVDAGAYVTTVLQPNVTPCCDINVHTPLPNVFTPNGDGVNDNYCIHVDGATSFNVWVINQGGSTIYSGSGPISPNQDPVCVWNGDGAESGDAYAILIELSNPCSGDDPVRVGTTTHVFRDAPGLSIDDNNYNSNYTNLNTLQADSIINLSEVDLHIISSPEYKLNSTLSDDWDFTIKPNPAATNTEISIFGNTTCSTLEVRIMDMRGTEIVLPFVLNGNQNILNLRDISSGMYWVTLRGCGTVKVKKLAIIK